MPTTSIRMFNAPLTRRFWSISSAPRAEVADAHRAEYRALGDHAAGQAVGAAENRWSRRPGVHRDGAPVGVFTHLHDLFAIQRPAIEVVLDLLLGLPAPEHLGDPAPRMIRVRQISS